MVRVPLRVVCHAIWRVDVVPADVVRLRGDVERRCAERAARLVDFVVDFGGVKRRAEEYPVLAYLRSGRADVLLVVRVPAPGRRGDWRRSEDLLESRVLPEGGAVAWATVPELRQLGLLPQAVGGASPARRRAASLRGKQFSYAAIARWLDSEGYTAPRRGRVYWTSADVVNLLRSAQGGEEAGGASAVGDGVPGMS